MKKIFLLLLCLCVVLNVFAQQNNDAQIEKVRAESGLDPSKSVTKIASSVWVSTPQSLGTVIQNNFNLQFAVKSTSFGFQAKLFSAINGNAHISGLSDFEFTATTVPFNFGKFSLGAFGKFQLPTGTDNAQGLISSNQFLITPGLIFVYALSQSSIICIQPQYTVSAVKPTAYPMTSLLSVRVFGALFTKNGFAGVLEIRPLYDFTRQEANLIVSPILTYNIGAGFTVNALVEVPVTNNRWETDGLTYKFGVSKSL